MKIKDLVLLPLFLLTACSQAQQEPTDYGIVISNEISNQRVNSFVEDRFGQIWIGTFRGLNLFTGEEYIQYFKNGITGMPNNEVYASLCDSRGRLWWTTTGGICYYKDDGTFVVPENGQTSLARQVIESPDGRIFFSDRRSILEYAPEKDAIAEVAVYDPAQNTSATIFFDSEGDLLLMTSAWVRYYDSHSWELKKQLDLPHPAFAKFPYKENRLWCSGSDGIFIFDMSSGKMEPGPRALRDNELLNNRFTYAFQYDEQTTLFASPNGKILVYDESDGRVYTPDMPHQIFSALDGGQNCMIKDRAGNVWYTSGYKGYSILYAEPSDNNYTDLSNAFSGKTTINITADRQENIWVATYGEGLFLCSRGNAPQQVTLHDQAGQKLPNTGKIMQLGLDNEDRIWLSTSACVYCLEKVRIKDGERLVKKWQFPYRAILSIVDDGRGNVWLGGFSPFVYCVDKSTGEGTQIRIAPNSYTLTPTIVSTNEGIIAGTLPYGIHLIDPDTKTVHPYIDLNQLQEAFEEDIYTPTCLYSDSRGLLWIGTDSNGLICYNPSRNQIRHIDGAPCENISAIIEDKDGYLWVSTQFGIGRYDQYNDSFTNYFYEDGIGGNQFMDRSVAELPDGSLAFGGAHGITVINPENTLQKREIPLVFEYLRIHNDVVYPGKDSPMASILPSCPKITIGHRQNGFSIAFAALNYSKGEKIRYSYKLEGHDNYWVDAGRAHEASFSNLRPGKYVFKVRIDGNRVAEKEISLNLIVKPNPWLGPWALLFYTLLLSAAVISFVRIFRNARAQQAAALKAKQEKEQEQRINQMNLNFFSNISHEFRTPLTLIAGPVSLLEGSKNLSEKDKNLLETIKKNASRMLNLVDQTLDIGRLDGESLPLKVAPRDAVPILKEQVDLFQVRAETKHISLDTFCPVNSLPILLDDDKFGKILGNLLSNACKFTPEGGKILVSMDIITRKEAQSAFPLKGNDTSQEWVRVTVADTGPGIPPEFSEKIFDRYYQVENHSDGHYNYGTGIGLFYTKALITLHHGYIKSVNMEGVSGAVLSFVLPRDESAYAQEERVYDLPYTEESAPQLVSNPKTEPSASQKNKTLLIVDDDLEVSKYLKDILSDEYNIVSRFDADSALAYLADAEPDLVISDVVMPGKDGYSLCREIKSNPDLSHLPVILVTAKTTVEDQIQGLETGADAYVPKPFDPYYLKSLIRSTLANRDRIRSLVQSSVNTETIATESLSSYDKEFLDRLYKLMDTELANITIDSDEMARKLYISRSKLFYKVKGLTGQTPLEFFKQYKLNRALELLKTGQYSITDISFMTGFSSPSKFSTQFKKRYGVSPSNYLDKKPD